MDHPRGLDKMIILFVDIFVVQIFLEYEMRLIKFIYKIIEIKLIQINVLRRAHFNYIIGPSEK